MEKVIGMETGTEIGTGMCGPIITKIKTGVIVLGIILNSKGGIIVLIGILSTGIIAITKIIKETMDLNIGAIDLLCLLRTTEITGIITIITDSILLMTV